MKILVNENEKLKRKFLKLLIKLPPEQFFGVTTILGVKLTDKDLDKSREDEPNVAQDGDTTITTEVKENSQTTITNISEEEGYTVIKPNLTIDDEEVLYVNEDGDIESTAADATKNNEEEKEKDNTKDAISILYECIEKFDALTITQKKNLLKIVKAGA